MNLTDNPMVSPTIAKKIDDAGVIAVVVLDKIEHTLPLAESLLLGGIDTIELTLRTPIALAAAKLLKKEVPQINLGFGTVITVDQVKQVVDIGADFAVAPGCNPKVIEAARKMGLSFAPGIMTPTDIEMAVAEDCRILKFFPAQTSGGLKHLQSISAPYKYLGLKFIPLGGVNLENAETYLSSPLITAVGGSWVAKQNLILDEQWDTISQNAKDITTLINKIKE